LHAKNGVFDKAKFRAKYGKLPDGLDSYGGYKKAPSVLSLFLYPGDAGLTVPQELFDLLLKVTSKPEPFRLASTAELPASFEQVVEHHEWQEGDEGITVRARGAIFRIPRQETTRSLEINKIPIVKREMEFAAQEDCLTVLRLIANGKVSVSDKTLRVTPAAARELAAHPEDGDYYYYYEPSAIKADGDETVGPIKAFSWPLLMQVAKLAEVHGKKLALTKAGLKALSDPAPITLKEIWHRWNKGTFFDEFQRIDAIKGQGGKGSQADRQRCRSANRLHALLASLHRRW
jgi:hypothetical protein